MANKLTAVTDLTVKQIATYLKAQGFSVDMESIEDISMEADGMIEFTGSRTHLQVSDFEANTVTENPDGTFAFDDLCRTLGDVEVALRSRGITPKPTRSLTK